MVCNQMSAGQRPKSSLVRSDQAMRPEGMQFVSNAVSYAFLNFLRNPLALDGKIQIMWTSYEYFVNLPKILSGSRLMCQMFRTRGFAPLSGTRCCSTINGYLLRQLVGDYSHTHQPDLIVSAEQWLSRSCKFVTCSCRPANFDTGKDSSAGHSQRERQKLLWRQYFRTIWWDSRQDKKISWSPGFRHKDSGESLWLNNFCKPAWLDVQATVLDTRIGGPAGRALNPTLPDNHGPHTVPLRQGCVTAHTVTKLCEEGQLSGAVDALTVLVQTGFRVSTSLLYSVLKRCVADKNLVVGRRIHDLTVKLGYESNAFLGNHILRMYACQGRLQEAMDVFTRVAKPDAYMWFSLISTHAKYGKHRQAIQLYHEMRRCGVKPDGHVFVAALQACAVASDLESGRQVHTDVLGTGVPPDSFVCNSLVDMYVKCGELEAARRVFDSLASRDVVTWTAMISGYVGHGLGQEALALYARMEHEGLILADSVTFACLLKACASVGSLQQGKQLHSQISKRGLLEGDMVVGSCLVDMYVKCGELGAARRVFDSLATRDLVTWTAMIAGYAGHGLGQDALDLYARMEQGGLLLADSVTFACLLKACASVGSLQQGKQLHSQILQRGQPEGDILVDNALVDMYAKCGKLGDARRVFDSMATKDVVTWNAMIHGYGRTNEGHKAMACFEEMLLSGVQPDDTTFTCLLVACSHEGLVNEGRQYFDAMMEQHGLEPTREHYTCMIDLLGRAGHLVEAENMLSSCGSMNDGFGLMSLLSACRSHGDIERGTRCFESLVRLDPQHASAYVLMANMFADAGRWTDVDRIERVRKLAGASKKPAVAGIEVNKQVHTFVVGEERDGISSKVRSTSVRLKEEGGHVPQTRLVLKPLSEKEKEDELCGHAEKLALAYGLLNTPHGTPLLVTKNLRMCRDCHSSTEIMSRIEKRDIVVRDAHRVHRFEAGSCSCKGRP